MSSPAQSSPEWSQADIRASRVQMAGASALLARPAWRADPVNLFVVVEDGDQHVSLVDGDRFEIIHRFPTRCALQGVPRFTPDGRYMYVGSGDGWVTKYDLWNLTVVVEARAGLSMPSVVVSGDGAWVLAASPQPSTLALFDADLNLVRSYPLSSLDGKVTSRASRVYDATPRRSFVVALPDLPELWEISYDPQAGPIHDGLVHDYRMGESIAKPGFLGVRRTPLAEPLEDFVFDPGFRHVIGSAGGQERMPARAQVVNLDIRRSIASLSLPGAPNWRCGIPFGWNGTMLQAFPNSKDASVTVVDAKTWSVVKTISTPGPGRFMRSHENTPYAWVDSMLSPTAHDRLTVIEKRSLQPVAQVHAPGKLLGQVEFTRDGRYVLVSVADGLGALIVYDAQTFREVKRLPMNRPAGHYNVGNEIARPGCSPR